MASCSEVVSFLRTLTSNPSNTTPAEKKREFDDVLLSNMERLRDAVGEESRFAQLKERLEIQNIHSHVADGGMTIDENTGICKKDSSDEDKHAKYKYSKPINEDLTQRKGAVRWTYVKTCLELLKLLKESLIKLKKESEGKKVQPVSAKRGNDAPPLPADALSVGDQKTVLTALQFVVMLGICPNLFPGVGVPVDKRSGFASLLNIRSNIKSERHLFECVDTLVECIAQPSLGSLVLSRHLGDILSGLLQICYAPVSAYTYLNFNNRSDGNESTNVNDCGARISSTLGSQTSYDTDVACKTLKDMGSVTLETKHLVKDDSSVQEHPNYVYKLANESLGNKGDNNHGLFTTSSEREKCVNNLQRILDRVYQPIVIRELLLLQGGQGSGGKRLSNVDTGRMSISGDNRRDNQGLKQSVLPSQTPKWLRNVCGQLLSERLMKPNGVKAVLQGILEGLTGSCYKSDFKSREGALPWEKGWDAC